MGLLVNQPQGLGDIIFSMTMVRTMASEYGDVLWPVRGEWVDGLRVAYPDIRFIDQRECHIDYDRKDWYEWHGLHVWPLRFAHKAIGKGSIDFMKSKYEAYKCDWQDWMEDGEFQRSDINEIALYSIKRKTRLHKPFVIVNTLYKSDCSGDALIEIDRAAAKYNGIDFVMMRPADGFSMFDWSKLLMNANEIHTVGTSLIYLLELLKPKCKVYVYPRRPQHTDHRRYDYILRSCDYVLMK